jgi:hypothetical protein
MTTRRFLRTLAGGAISGGLYAGFDFLKATPLGVFIIPVQAAVISALGKLLREKWKINLPI